MAEERFTSKYDGTTQDNLLEFAENLKRSTTVDGAETINVQGFTLPRISDISGFVAVNNVGNAIGFMSKDQVASVLGELIGVAAPGKAGLMSGSYGLLPRMDINDANKLYNGFAKISTGCLNVPNGFNGYLIAFSPDLYIVVQIAINSNGSQMFLRSNWDGWRSWYQVI